MSQSNDGPSVSVECELVSLHGTPLGPGTAIFTLDDISVGFHDVIDDVERVVCIPYDVIHNLLTKENRVCLILPPGPLLSNGFVAQDTVDLPDDTPLVKLVLTLCDMSVFHDVVMPMLGGGDADASQLGHLSASQASQFSNTAATKTAVLSSQNPTTYTKTKRDTSAALPRVSTVSCPLVSVNGAIRFGPITPPAPENNNFVISAPVVVEHVEEVHDKVEEEALAEQPLPPDEDVQDVDDDGIDEQPTLDPHRLLELSVSDAAALSTEHDEGRRAVAAEELSDRLAFLPKHCALVRATTHKDWIAGWKDAQKLFHKTMPKVSKTHVVPPPPPPSPPKAADHLSVTPISKATARRPSTTAPATITKKAPIKKDVPPVSKRNETHHLATAALLMDSTPPPPAAHTSSCINGSVETPLLSNRIPSQNNNRKQSITFSPWSPPPPARKAPKKRSRTTTASNTNKTSMSKTASSVDAHKRRLHHLVAGAALQSGDADALKEALQLLHRVSGIPSHTVPQQQQQQHDAASPAQLRILRDELQKAYLSMGRAMRMIDEMM